MNAVGRLLSMIPEKLSHYRIVQQIGAGGMGVVYRAHDEHLDRDVALKVLPQSMVTDERTRQRFRKEALALAKLNHPNIGAIYEFGNDAGVDFLVMEFISGVTLDAKLSGGALPEKDVLRFGMQLADGLDAAHSQRIVHRDLKPGNIRLTPDGWIKILDFGIAQFVASKGDSAETITLTQHDSIMGTVAYMSPEQIRGQRADVRSDIYSTGVVLYEMATGKRPFADRSGPQLISAILETPPSPPTSQNHAISPALESIIVKALDKEPDRRYQSARELRVDLERLSSGVVPIQPARVPSKAPFAIAAASLLFLVGAGFLLTKTQLFKKTPITQITSPSFPQRRSVAVLGFHNLSQKPENAWLSTALSEMLTTELAAGEQLRTIPGENVTRMRNDLSLPEADSYAQRHAETNLRSARQRPRCLGIVCGVGRRHPAGFPHAGRGFRRDSTHVFGEREIVGTSGSSFANRNEPARQAGAGVDHSRRSCGRSGDGAIDCGRNPTLRDGAGKAARLRFAIGT
jgi:serine/threonine protein kinase